MKNSNQLEPANRKSKEDIPVCRLNLYRQARIVAEGYRVMGLPANVMDIYRDLAAEVDQLGEEVWQFTEKELNAYDRARRG